MSPVHSRILSPLPNLALSLESKQPIYPFKSEGGGLVREKSPPHLSSLSGLIAIIRTGEFEPMGHEPGSPSLLEN